MSDIAAVLDDLTAFVRRYMVLDEAELTAVALWAFHSHAFAASDATPYLSVTSAEKESGKTRLLEVLELVVARPWLTGRVTAAVLARKVDKETPTLLLDESDAAFGGEKEYAEVLRGILNSGHRRGGRASLCVGQGAAISYVDLSTFCPKAIAGIGELPDTVASRSIPIRLKRKAPGEQVERFRRREALAAAEPLATSLESLASYHVEHLAAARPALPDELGDRAADSWEPLLAVADRAGGEWPERARRAALELSGRGAPDDGSIGVRLLADIHTAFGERRNLATKALIDELAEDEEAPWGTWHKGSRMSPRALARLLEPFGIRSTRVRIGEETPKGYRREDFEDAWNRYLPARSSDSGRTEGAHTPSVSATTPQPASAKGKRPEPIRNTTPHVADTKTASNPHEQRDVADVADRNGERAGLSAQQRAALADKVARAKLERQDAERAEEDRKHAELDIGTATLGELQERLG